MAEGTLDVRTRDNKRHGKIRVDEVAKMLAAETPAKATAFNNFYEKAFDPVKHFGSDVNAPV